MNPLNFLLISPILSIIYVLFLCNNDDIKKRHTRSVGLTLSIGILGLAFYVLRAFVLYAKTFYYSFNLGLFRYSVEINGISVLFLFLTALLTVICLLSLSSGIKYRYKEIIIHFFFLEFAIFGVFLAKDIIMFYIFFELTLIPMFFIIGIWGGKNKLYSTFKLFLYTFAGSILFLLVIIYLVSKYETTSILQLIYYISSPEKGLSFNVEKILWVLTFIAFAVKIPMVPFHTWLPNAHVEAPTSGSVMLAGILIKLGGYAMITILLPFFPKASVYFQDYVIMLSIVAIIYTSIVALQQSDIKKMIAYSSVAHMGYVTVSIFTFTQNGFAAAIFQMISHGIVSGALFLSIGVIYERLHTRDFINFGGITQKMPQFALLFMIFTMASAGLPGTSGFVGEFLAIVSVFKVSPVYGILTATGMVLGAYYILIMYKKTMFGVIKNDHIASISDITKTEKITLGVLCVLCIILGVYPQSILHIIPIFNVVVYQV